MELGETSASATRGRRRRRVRGRNTTARGSRGRGGPRPRRASRRVPPRFAAVAGPAARAGARAFRARAGARERLHRPKDGVHDRGRVRVVEIDAFQRGAQRGKELRVAHPALKLARERRLRRRRLHQRIDELDERARGTGRRARGGSGSSSGHLGSVSKRLGHLAEDAPPRLGRSHAHRQQRVSRAFTSVPPGIRRARLGLGADRGELDVQDMSQKTRLGIAAK